MKERQATCSSFYPHCHSTTLPRGESEGITARLIRVVLENPGKGIVMDPLVNTSSANANNSNNIPVEPVEPSAQAGIAMREGAGAADRAAFFSFVSLFFPFPDDHTKAKPTAPARVMQTIYGVSDDSFGASARQPPLGTSRVMYFIS